MANNITVYGQLTSSTEALIKVVQHEVGVKACQPFAVRAFDALSKLSIKTDAEARLASNIFLDNLQSLLQGGVTTEDYDKIDFVQRGNIVTISARVQALIRACRRKGFTLKETIVAVPKDDDVYFEEEYKDGVGIIYLLKDGRKQPDRDITAERLINNYFKRFLCRLEIKNNITNEIIMTTTEMTNSEVMNAQASSENGLFQSEWVTYLDKYQKEKKKKIIHDGSDGNDPILNKNSIWYKWTSEMVKKTIIRRALKNIKETLPELQQTFMAFDKDEELVKEVKEKAKPDIQEVIIEADGVETIKVDLLHLTKEQQSDVDEMFDIYKQNPKTAQADAEHIKELYETGMPIQDIIDEHYPELVNISKSKKLYPLIENILNGVPYDKKD